jgi:hypothetical protein
VYPLSDLSDHHIYYSYPLERRPGRNAADQVPGYHYIRLYTFDGIENRERASSAMLCLLSQPSEYFASGILDVAPTPHDPPGFSKQLRALHSTDTSIYYMNSTDERIILSHIDPYYKRVDPQFGPFRLAIIPPPGALSRTLKLRKHPPTTTSCTIGSRFLKVQERYIRGYVCALNLETSQNLTIR